MKKKQEIRELPIPPSTGVRDFVFPALKDPSLTVYDDARSKFGALAATDEDRESPTQKDSRFVLHPTTREKLFIEIEERRVIEERVRNRVEAFQEEVRARAYTEGFEAGKKDGFKAASDEVKSQAKEKMAGIDSFLKGAEEAKLQILAANETIVLELVHQIAAMLALRDIQSEPGYVLRLARTILERIGVRENILIRVNRQEYESLKLLKDDLEKELGALQNVNVIPSDTVKMGGCQVETDLSAIDASIATQLENVRAALTGTASK